MSAANSKIDSDEIPDDRKGITVRIAPVDRAEIIAKATAEWGNRITFSEAIRRFTEIGMQSLHNAAPRQPAAATEITHSAIAAEIKTLLDSADPIDMQDLAQRRAMAYKTLFDELLKCGFSNDQALTICANSHTDI